MENFKIKDLMITVHPGKNYDANVLNHAIDQDCYAPTKCSGTSPDCYAPTKCSGTLPDNYLSGNMVMNKTGENSTGSLLLRDIKKALAGMSQN